MVVHSSVQVRYKGEDVGDQVADMIVEDHVLLALKAQEKLPRAHKAQVLS